MSVQKVVLTAADEQYAPPKETIEVTLIDDLLFIAVCEYEEDGKGSSAKVRFNVPPLRIHEFLAALNAFSNAGNAGWHVVVPTPNPASPDTETGQE